MIKSLLDFHTCSTFGEHEADYIDDCKARVLKQIRSNFVYRQAGQ